MQRDVVRVCTSWWHSHPRLNLVSIQFLHCATGQTAHSSYSNQKLSAIATSYGSRHVLPPNAWGQMCIKVVTRIRNKSIQWEPGGHLITSTYVPMSYKPSVAFGRWHRTYRLLNQDVVHCTTNFHSMSWRCSSINGGMEKAGKIYLRWTIAVILLTFNCNKSCQPITVCCDLLPLRFLPIHLYWQIKVIDIAEHLFSHICWHFFENHCLWYNVLDAIEINIVLSPVFEFRT